MNCRWIDLAVVLAINDRQLAEHGGLDGVRDMAALESALDRPRNRAAHEEPDAAVLAAAYAFGLARNHAFLDGNKRTAWVVARLFLVDNGHRLAFDPADSLHMMEQLGAGAIGEAELAAWFRTRMTAPERD